jgi:ribonuclease HI
MWQIAHVADSLHAETIACLKAIKFAIELGMGRIIIETDATLLSSPIQ